MHVRPAFLYSKHVHKPTQKTENKRAIPIRFEMTLPCLSSTLSGLLVNRLAHQTKKRPSHLLLRQPLFYFPVLSFNATFAEIFRVMSDQQMPNQLNIEISEEMAEGQYANLAIITHSHAEFVLDFVNVMPGTPKSKVKSRIILTPQHAKRLMKALVDNVQKFEAVNGMIKDLEEVQIPMQFGGPTAQA
jgi:hypothetical protein